MPYTDTKIESIKGESLLRFSQRYAMIVEYNGYAYSGSQKQLNARTIQSEVEDAILKVTGITVKTIFSGRTDAKVNSKGQTVHFDLPHKTNINKLIYSLNSVLPADIAIREIIETDKDFHAQKSACWRWYRYTIFNRREKSVFNSNLSLHVPKKLNIAEMNTAMQFLIGKHDFSAFKSTGSSVPSDICNMISAQCFSEDDSIYLDVVADRFLYNMVRIIAGTAVEIGLGNFNAVYMQEVLNSKDRAKAGKTARPEALTLMSVGYNMKYNFETLNKEKANNEILLRKAS